jgi:hypothetical protein
MGGFAPPGFTHGDSGAAEARSKTDEEEMEAARKAAAERPGAGPEEAGAHDLDRILPSMDLALDDLFGDLGGSEPGPAARRPAGPDLDLDQDLDLDPEQVSPEATASLLSQVLLL